MVSDDPLVSLPGGSKRSLRYFRQKLEDYNVNWDALWQKIRRVVLAALFSAQAKIPFQPNSFELFGFDVMVDESLKVWLLEVNASPSLGIQTPLALAAPEHRAGEHEEDHREGERRYDEDFQTTLVSLHPRGSRNHPS